MEPQITSMQPDLLMFSEYIPKVSQVSGFPVNRHRAACETFLLRTMIVYVTLFLNPFPRERDLHYGTACL
jgi:hypothetical protein